MTEDEAYREAIRRWVTPKDVDDLRRMLGSAEAILDRNEQVMRLLEKEDKKEAVWQFIKAAALAFVTIVGVLATIKAVLPAGWIPW